MVMTGNTPRSLYGSEFEKPYRPTRSPEAGPFWAGCQEGRLMLPFCPACSRFHFYPRPFCPHCGGAVIEWKPAAGTGTVHTFATVHQPIEKAFAPLVPYVLGVVDLDEGVRMLTHIVDHGPDGVHCGLRVAVGFRTLSDTLTIPVFAPA